MTPRMIAAIVMAIVGALGGCRISDVDLAGKHCPCAAGFTCNDATQLCALDGTLDAAIDTPVDVPHSASCLDPSPQDTMVFDDEFSDLQKWTLVGGSWAAAGGQAEQTDVTSVLAFAYPSSVVAAMANYHVVTNMHQLAHAVDNSAYEIAFRIQPATMDMFHCNFEPNDHTLVIQHTMGASTPVLVSSVIPVGTNYDPNTSVTMELLVQNTMATCCIRELAGASVTTTAITTAQGPPGMKTFRISAAYGGFQIFH